jgi:protein KRI1
MLLVKVMVDDDDDETGGSNSKTKKKPTKNKSNKTASGTTDGDIGWEEQMKEEQDDDFFLDAEQWEQEYQQAQYRHQEGAEALRVQTFPRQATEGLLRQKDTARRDARERKQERLAAAETKVEQDVKRLKALKRQEIDAQRERIAAVAGIPPERMKRLARLMDEELGGGAEFDAAAFDKAMEGLFDESYYDDMDDAELNLMETEMEEGLVEESDDDDDDDDDGGQDEADGAAAAGKKKEDDVNPFDDDELLYPTKFAEKHMNELAELAAAQRKSKNSNSGAVAAAGSSKTFSTNRDVQNRLQRQLDSKLDEYWKLHHEDVLADGTRTRFRYRSVPAETFGLTSEDILTTDDRTLNMVAPMNCYAAYLTEEQNRRDRYKAMHRASNMRFLNPNRKSRRYKADTVAIDVEGLSEEQGEAMAEKLRGMVDQQQQQQQQAQQGQKKKAKGQQQQNEEEAVAAAGAGEDNAAAEAAAAGFGDRHKKKKERKQQQHQQQAPQQAPVDQKQAGQRRGRNDY